MDQLNIPGQPLIRRLRFVIRIAVQILAFLMTLVILLGVVDVAWVLYKEIMTPPYGMLTINDILATFGAFIAVLIAIELFLNIVLYLRDDIIHVRLVVATALMAIARKVIVFDFKEISPQYVYATGAVVLALGVTYWLVSKSAKDVHTVKRGTK